MSFSRNEIKPINCNELTDWDLFVENVVRRKVAKCLSDLGGRFPNGSMITVKRCFWNASDSLKLLNESDDGFCEAAGDVISSAEQSCISELGAAVSESEINTIRHWFGILKTDIIGE